MQQLFAGLNRAVIFNGLEREGGFDWKSEAFIFGWANLEPVKMYKTNIFHFITVVIKGNMLSLPTKNQVIQWVWNVF